MKVYDVISESVEVNEAPANWFAQKARGLGAKLGSRSLATTLATGDEANELKSELRAWMKGSKIPSGALTPEDLETYLDQKGYGGIAKPIIDKMRSVPPKKSVGATVAGYAGMAGKAIKNASGVNPPPPAGTPPVSEARPPRRRTTTPPPAAGTPPAGVPPTPAPSAPPAPPPNPATAGTPPAGAGPTPAPNAPPQERPLKNSEVDKVLAAVVAQAYKTGAGFTKGRFAKNTPTAPAGGSPVDLNSLSPNDAKAVRALQQRGFTVTK